jgi:ATP-dependent Clp protease ATP-binding subunit ClpA
MFERFTQEARAVVIGAQLGAREMGSALIEPIHLLVGLYHVPGMANSLLAGFGVSPDDLAADVGRVRRRGGMSDSDVEALGEFGIDVEQIVERVEQIHGKGVLAGRPREMRGHIPFSPEAKKALEQSLREALGSGDKHIGQEHLLLALAARPGPAADVLAKRDITYLAIRHALHERKAS